MTKNPKKRLCWNCEGSVAINAETCPYCGVSVVPASLDQPSHSFAPSYQPGLSSEAAIPRSPFIQDEKISTEPEIPVAATKVIEEGDGSLDNFKSSLIAAVMMLTGSAFFLFGLVLLLFSHKGVLTLQWDASVWFIYSGLSLPLLIIGWRALRKLEDAS